jgi:eukaryotic-like serine/threonine-protein kinase
LSDNLGDVPDLTSNRYRIEAVLGSGGMAVVALARDQQLDRSVAIKLLADHLSNDDRFRARFVREARMAARLAHPNIVQVYDVGDDGRRPYIVMEHVEGQTLADVLDERGPFPAPEVVDIAVQVCAGLEHAHAAGLVHRDIKPRNILLRSDGMVKITDFGIARDLDGTNVTQTGVVMGTVGYLAPEQATGDHPVSAASDLYSLGAVLYQLLTGRPPFTGRTVVELVAQQHARRVVHPSELAADVPPALEAAILRCLDPDPAGRPRSAADLARELAAASPESTTEPVPAATGVRATEVLPEDDGSTRPLTEPVEAAPVPERRGLSGRAWLVILGILVIAGFVVGLLLSGGLDSPTSGGRELTPTERTIRDARDLADWIREQAG